MDQWKYYLLQKPKETVNGTLHLTAEPVEGEYARNRQASIKCEYRLIDADRPFIIFHAILTPSCLYLWTENGCLKATEHIIIPVEGIIDPQIVLTTGSGQEAPDLFVFFVCLYKETEYKAKRYLIYV